MIQSAKLLVEEVGSVEPIEEVAIELATASIVAIIAYFAGRGAGRKHLTSQMVFGKYKQDAIKADTNTLATIAMIPLDDNVQMVFDKRKAFAQNIKEIAAQVDILRRDRPRLIEDARVSFINYLETALALYKKEMPPEQKALVRSVKNGLKSLR